MDNALRIIGNLLIAAGIILLIILSRIGPDPLGVFICIVCWILGIAAHLSAMGGGNKQ